MSGEHAVWAERAATALADAGYRRGGARRAILDVLAGQDCALTVAELEDQLAARGRAVSRASVYRVMEELEQIGMVQRVEVGTGLARYEAVGVGSAHHHHLVCERCGRIEPFHDDALELAIERVSQAVPLVVTEHEIVIRGACRRCAPPN